MKNEWKILAFAVLIVGGLWGVFLLLTFAVSCSGKSAPFGEMGDAFNMLNSLFAGLAFAAVFFQLWMHQKQIDEERGARHRAERISAFSTLIQVTLEKILHERTILLQVAPGFKNVSFLHKGDGVKIGQSIHAKMGQVQSAKELLVAIRKAEAEGYLPTESSGMLKEIWDNEAAIPMMKQINKWVDQLAEYEVEMDKLLRLTPQVLETKQ